MNEQLKTALFGLLVIFIQIGSGPLLQIAGAKPDFMLIWVLLVALQRGRLYGLVVGVLGGLTLDFVSIGPLGTHALAMSSIAFWLGVWLDSRVGSVPIGWWLMILAGASMAEGMFMGFFNVYLGEASYSAYVFLTVLPATIYTVIVGTIWALAPMGARSRGPLAPATVRGRRSLR